MARLEFVTTEDSGERRVISPPSERFVLGTEDDAVTLPTNLTRNGRVEVIVRENQLFVRALGTTAMQIDGQEAGQGTLVAGQVLRVGEFGLYVRPQGLQIGGSNVTTTYPPPPERPQVFDQTLESAALRPGSVINGRYEVISKLAAGGMGEVYKVEHVELRRLFALKTMRIDLSFDQDFVARFKREAVACSRIGQQNIIDVSDFGRTELGQFFFVMEYLDGVTLASALHHSGPMSVKRVITIGLQIARALAAAHEQGVVHRDLKPENIMLLQRPGQSDFVKVLDFGIAKVTPTAGEDAPKGQTAVGMVVGTPQYMAPEQAVGQPADARTDIYAVGLLLHEMLTGKAVFSGATVSEIILQQVSSPAPGLCPGPSGDIPPALETLVLQMLAKPAADRPQRMEEVIEALERLSALRDRAAVQVTTRMPAIDPPRRTVPEQRSTPALPAEAEVVDDARALTSRRGPVLAVGGGVFVVTLAAWFALRPAEPPVTTPPVPAPAPLAAPVVAAPVVAPEAAPVPPPPAPVATFEVELVSRPEHVSVFEGALNLGVTPLRLSRPTGVAVELRFEAPGFKSLRQTVHFEGEHRQVAALTAEPRPAHAPVRSPSDDIKDPFAAPPASDIKNPF
jgi:serine/threonine-protein kinase